MKSVVRFLLDVVRRDKSIVSRIDLRENLSKPFVEPSLHTFFKLCDIAPREESPVRKNVYVHIIQRSVDEKQKNPRQTPWQMFIFRDENELDE